MNTTMTHFSAETFAYGVDFSEKVARALTLIRGAHMQLGDRLVVEHNLTRESCAVWDLAKRACPKIRGFCIATRFQPPETIKFMERLVAQFPEIRIYESYQPIPEVLPDVNPVLCCEFLRNRPKRQALKEMGIFCLMSGLHNTYGSARLPLSEFQQITGDLSELAPILNWDDLDVTRYLEARRIQFNPVHQQDVRRFGCSACHREFLRGCTLGKAADVIRLQAQKNVLEQMRHSA